MSVGHNHSKCHLDCGRMGFHRTIIRWPHRALPMNKPETTAVVIITRWLQVSHLAILHAADDTSLAVTKRWWILGCSGISWTICKQSASCCRQITTPTPHHSVFLQAGCTSWCPTNSVKALKVQYVLNYNNIDLDMLSVCEACEIVSITGVVFVFW